VLVKVASTIDTKNSVVDVSDGAKEAPTPGSGEAIVVSVRASGSIANTLEGKVPL